MAKEKEVAIEAPKLFIEKHLATRTDLSDSIKRVLSTIFKGQMNTSDEWKEIISRRLSKPAV